MAEPASALSEARSGWTAAIAVSIGMFVLATDQVMLPSGAPAMASDLGTTVGGVQAAIAVVSLVAAPLYIAGGKLGDKLGKKRGFLVGLICYGVGALGAALAPGFGVFLLSWFPMASLLFLLSGAIPFTVPVFLQSGVGFDPTTAGLAMVAFSIGSMLLGFTSAALLERLTPRPLLQVTIVVLAVGLGWLALAAESDVTFWAIAAPMVVIGAAFGVIGSQAPNIQMSALEPHQVGEGSGLAEVGKEIGVGLGTAVIGGILLSSALTATVDGVLRSADLDVTPAQRQQIVLEVEDLGGVDALAEADLPDDLRAELQRVVPQAYSDGMRLAIGAMFLVVVLAFVAASLLPAIEPESVTDDDTTTRAADVTARRT